MLLLCAGEFAGDPARGMAAANVAVRHLTLWIAALLDYPFLPDGAPALREVDATRKPKISARDLS